MWGFLPTQIKNILKAVLVGVGMEEVLLCAEHVFIPSDPGPAALPGSITRLEGLALGIKRAEVN